MLRQIRKIDTPCMDREHNPPMHISLSPGTYVHECPSCHKTVTFNVGFVY